MSQQNRSIRRFFQFGMRTLLILMIASAIGMGYYRSFVASRAGQRKAGDALAEKGVTLQWRSIKPDWLRDILGLFQDEEDLRYCYAVDAHHRGLTDVDLRHLKDLPDVQRLYLAGNPITDDGMKNLIGLHKLQRLSLWRTGVTDNGLKYIGHLHSLEVVDIHDATDWHRRLGSGRRLVTSQGVKSNPPATEPKITSKCLPYLATLKNLKVLHFSFPVGDDGLAALATMPKLRIHTLILDGVTDRGMEKLPYLPTLDILQIRQSEIGPDGMRALGQMSKLWRLHLDRVRIAGGGWRHLQSLPNLTNLDLYETTIESDDLKYAGGLNVLEHLSLRNTDIGDDGFKNISGLTQLRSLDLRDTNLTADCIQHLRNMQQLTELYFEAPMDDDAVGWLASLPNLERIEGDSHNSPHSFYVTDKGLADLAKISQINFVKLFDADTAADLPGVDFSNKPAQMTDAGLEVFWKNNHSQVVHVAGRNVSMRPLSWRNRYERCHWVQLNSAKNATEVIDAPLGKNVESARLHSRGLSIISNDHGRPCRIEVNCAASENYLSLLRYMPAVKKLNLTPIWHGKRHLTDWSGLQFAKDLEEFEAEFPSNNSFGVPAEAFRWLGEMPNLRMLKCTIRDNLAPDSLAALGRLKKLEEVEFRCRMISAIHLSHIGKIPNLTTLRVFGRIASAEDQDGLAHLAKSKLQELWLNGVDEIGMSHIGKIKSLTRLSISSNRLDDEAIRHLDGMPQLSYVDMRSALSGTALREFHARNPRIHVRTDGVRD